MDVHDPRSPMGACCYQMRKGREGRRLRERLVLGRGTSTWDCCLRWRKRTWTTCDLEGRASVESFTLHCPVELIAHSGKLLSNTSCHLSTFLYITSFPLH